MDLNDFRYKVSRMSPLKRAFTSAALGVGAFGLVMGVNMVAPGLTTIASLGVSLGGSILVSSYSDPAKGAFNVLGLNISKDSLLNIGAFFGSYIFVAPQLVGAALGLMAAASPAGNAVAESPASTVQSQTLDIS